MTNLTKAIDSLKGYCKPWDKGGAGDNFLTDDIKIVLNELEQRDRAILGMLNSVAETLKNKHRPEDFYCLHLRTLAFLTNWRKG